MIRHTYQSIWQSYWTKIIAAWTMALTARFLMLIF
jgi:hypothetical protein